MSETKPKMSKRQRAMLRHAFEDWLKTADVGDLFTPTPELMAKYAEPEVPKPAMDRLPQVVARGIEDLSRALHETKPDQRAKCSPVRVIQEAIAEISIMRTRVLTREVEAQRLRESGSALVQNGIRLSHELEEVTRALAAAQDRLRELRRPVPEG